MASRNICKSGDNMVHGRNTVKEETHWKICDNAVAITALRINRS